MLPSTSALSDLGLIADHFEKMVLNWSSFCLKKSAFWHKNSKESDFHSFSLPHKSKKSLKISLNIEYFQIKVDLLNVKNKFLEQV